MKPYFVILAGLVFSAPLARAQVMINPAALNQLAGIPPVVVTAPPVMRRPVHRTSYRPVLHRRVVTPTAAPKLAASRVVPNSAPAPVVPAAPVQPVVARPAAPKPPVLPPNADITFAAGVADLPANAAAQLKPFCVHSAATGQVTIDAYAAPDPADLSAALRLSMSRAFALRDALAACGVPSASIIPRADGAGKNPDVAVISAAP